VSLPDAADPDQGPVRVLAERLAPNATRSMRSSGPGEMQLGPDDSAFRSAARSLAGGGCDE